MVQGGLREREKERGWEWGRGLLSPCYNIIPLLIYQDEDITTEESFREACIKAGLSLEQADELIGKISGEEIKEELKKTTQEALDLGVGRDYKTKQKYMYGVLIVLCDL